MQESRINKSFRLFDLRSTRIRDSPALRGVYMKKYFTLLPLVLIFQSQNGLSQVSANTDMDDVRRAIGGKKVYELNCPDKSTLHVKVGFVICKDHRVTNDRYILKISLTNDKGWFAYGGLCKNDDESFELVLKRSRPDAVERIDTCKDKDGKSIRDLFKISETVMRP